MFTFPDLFSRVQVRGTWGSEMHACERKRGKKDGASVETSLYTREMWMIMCEILQDSVILDPGSV